jgi:hypothetical protein
MRLEGIKAGHIVEVDRLGRRFHAIVTASAPGGLELQPIDRRINYFSCRSREVTGHWAKRGCSSSRGGARAASSSHLGMESSQSLPG